MKKRIREQIQNKKYLCEKHDSCVKNGGLLNQTLEDKKQSYQIKTKDV